MVLTKRLSKLVSKVIKFQLYVIIRILDLYKVFLFSRPEFAANAPYLEKNPITGIKVWTYALKLLIP